MKLWVLALNDFGNGGNAEANCYRIEADLCSLAEPFTTPQVNSPEQPSLNINRNNALLWIWQLPYFTRVTKLVACDHHGTCIVQSVRSAQNYV